MDREQLLRIGFCVLGGFVAGLISSKVHAQEEDISTFFARHRGDSDPVFVRDAQTGRTVGIWNHGNGTVSVQPVGERKPGDVRYFNVQRDRDTAYVREIMQPRPAAGGKR